MKRHWLRVLFICLHITARWKKGESYILKAARGGDVLPEASVKLSFIDISARYGTDYKIYVINEDSLFNDRPVASENTTSILEEIETSQEEAIEIDDTAW